jgi:putative Holliday junction resolvase
MSHYLGLDLGTVTLGISISRTGIISSPYEEFRFPEKEWHIALQEVSRIVKLETIDVIVIGLPLHADGSESEMSKNVREFRKLIHKEVPWVRLALQDESLTSAEANGLMLEADMSRSKRKKIVDRMAAQLILERYLEKENK